MGIGSFFTKLASGDAVSAVQGVANIVDQFVETPDEKRIAEQLLLRMSREGDKVQAEINKIEAGHRSVFVAGWRPFIGWVCGVGLSYAFLINPIMQRYSGTVGPELPLDSMISLVVSLLGLGTLRTVEKITGTTK